MTCRRCPVRVLPWEPSETELAILHDLIGAIGTLAASVELASDDPWLTRQASDVRRRAEQWQDLVEPARLGATPERAIGGDGNPRWADLGDGTIEVHGDLGPTKDHTLLARAADPGISGLKLATAIAWIHARGGFTQAHCDGRIRGVTGAP